MQVERTEIVLKPDQRGVLFLSFKPEREKQILKIAARVMSLTKEEVDNEWKHIQTPKPNIEIKKGQSKKKNEINITTDKPAFFVDLYHPQLSFSDRGFILLPGEEKTIQMSNRKKRTINF